MSHYFDFDRLFDASIADVIIKTIEIPNDENLQRSEVCIPAHSFILCLRSEVFKAMFKGNMSESFTREVFIPDFSPPVVKEMIRYLYTDECSAEFLHDHSEELLAIACKYDLSGLQAVCENHLVSALTISNVASILQLADTFQARQLKQRALLFLSQNAKSVVATEGFFANLGVGLCQEVICVLAGIEKPATDVKASHHE